MSFRWIGAGDRVLTGCRHVASDDAALYCPNDDAIYIGDVFAAGILRGIGDNFPGQRAGQGRAIGNFGLAYVVVSERRSVGVPGVRGRVSACAAERPGRIRTCDLGVRSYGFTGPFRSGSLW